MLPHLLKVRPWLLLIVIANSGRNDDYNFKVSGRSLSDGCIVIRGMYIISPLEVTLNFLVVMSVAHATTTVYLAPLQCDLEILRILNNIIIVLKLYY